MATGRTSIPGSPGPRKKGPKIQSYAEAATQTYVKGAVVQLSAGYIAKVGAGVAAAGSIRGFATKAGQNGATAGAKTASFYRVEQGEEYVGALEGAWSAALAGSLADLTVNADGSFYIDATGPVTNNVKIQRLAPGFTATDTNPAVYFVVLDSFIQT